MAPETIAHLQKSAGRFPEGDLLRMMEIIRRSEYDLKRNAFPRFAIEMMLLKLVYLDSTLSIRAAARPGGSEEAKKPGPRRR